MLDLIAYDLETHLIQPGLQAPPIVVGSSASLALGGPNDPCDIRVGPPLFPARVAVDFLRTQVLETDVLLVGANIFYDLACAQQSSLERGVDLMPLIFRKLERDQVWDVQLAEMLHAIGAGHLGYSVTGRQLPGRYSLDVIVEEVTGRRDAKRFDKYRLRYHELEHVPIEQWPAEARDYLGDDVRNPLDVTARQLGSRPRRGAHRWGQDGRCVRCDGVIAGEPCLALQVNWNVADVAEQCRAAWALTLAGAHGFARDARVVNMIAAAYARTHGPGSDAAFREAGLIRPDGSEDQGVLARLLIRAYSGREDPCPRCAAPTERVDRRGRCRLREARPGKVRNAKDSDWINCPDCLGSGLVVGPEVPRAEKGGIKTDRDTLFESGDEFLVEYAEHTEDEKTDSTYLPWLRADLESGVPLCTRFNALVKTGRVSADGPIQTLKRAPGAWHDDD